MYFYGIQESEFLIFSRCYTQSQGFTPQPISIRIFMDLATTFSCNIQDGAFCEKKWVYNNREMLMTVVTESFVLNVTGLLDWTLKHIDKCRLRQYQYSIRHLHIQTHQKNTKTKCQIYSKLAINSPERHHVLLLLILNIFCT